LGLAEGLPVRSGTGLWVERLQARRTQKWASAEWVSQMDLIGD